MNSTYTALAAAAPLNLSFDLLRRNNIAWLERQLDALSVEYKALKAAGDERAATVRAEGLTLHAQYQRALRSERMGAE